MDLQNNEQFRRLDTELVSIAIDPASDLAEDASRLEITTPFLSDSDRHVSDAYGVLRWAMPSGEPGHTFVLIDKQGLVRWIQDYGTREHGGRMYVDVDELYTKLASLLET